MRPSFISSTLSGIIIFIASIYYISNIKQINETNQTIILLLLGIGIGIHSLSHYYEEIYFNFNPLIGQWKSKDKPNNSV